MRVTHDYYRTGVLRPLVADCIHSDELQTREFQRSNRPMLKLKAICRGCYRAQSVRIWSSLVEPEVMYCWQRPIFLASRASRNCPRLCCSGVSVRLVQIKGSDSLWHRQILLCLCSLFGILSGLLMFSCGIDFVKKFIQAVPSLNRGFSLQIICYSLRSSHNLQLMRRVK